MSQLRVLVTGAEGVIGRRLVAALVARGHRVVGLVRKPSAFHFPDRVQVVEGDLTDQGVARKAVALLADAPSAQRAVVHLAGAGSAALARMNSGTAFVGNVVVTETVLSTAHAFDVRRLVFASTGLVYGRGGKDPMRETMPPAPVSIYGATKRAAEALVEGYSVEWNMSSEVARISNIYGPDSPDSTVVGRVLARVRSGQPANVESRTPIRDFIYIDDVVEAFCRLLDLTEEPGCRITNVSSGSGTRIGELVNTAHRIAGLPVEGPEADSFHDCLLLANDRLASRTGWRPATRLEDGLRICIRGKS